MKTLLYIILILILIAATVYFGIRLYKKKLVDQILYNCKDNCDARRSLLMTKSIKELKQMIVDIENLALSLSDITTLRSLCGPGYHWVGSLATGACKSNTLNY